MLKQHQMRVVDENTELAAKIERLEAFIGSPEYHALGGPDQFLLRKQVMVMREYLDILALRISRFVTQGVRDG